MLSESRRIGKILRALNSTFLTLIPQKNGTEDPRRLRLIAVCNVIYKIILEVMANHSLPLLPLFVSLEQVWFMEARKSLDGIILVHEAIHHLKPQIL